MDDSVPAGCSFGETLGWFCFAWPFNPGHHANAQRGLRETGKPMLTSFFEKQKNH